MRAKLYLTQLRGMNERLQTFRKTALLALDNATKVTTAYDKIAIDRSLEVDADKKQSMYAVAMERLRAEEDRMLEVQTEIRCTIQQLTDNNLATLLMLYYDGIDENGELYTWEKVAEEMHYSRQRIDQLHSQAIQEVQAILDERSKYGF